MECVYVISYCPSYEDRKNHKDPQIHQWHTISIHSIGFIVLYLRMPGYSYDPGFPEM